MKEFIEMSNRVRNDERRNPAMVNELGMEDRINEKTNEDEM
ncbi:MAG TPA: hypothetical protein PKN36_04810 [bacterium]|nr:hypothetical protein [bacterium]